MLKIVLIIALLSSLVFPLSSPTLAIAAEFGVSSEMNGYRLEQFGDFQKWHLVTVRYRRDTDEMRFTYANDLAWETLQKGETDFPDGAVFAKTGIATQEDPEFTSSAVPSGAIRYQFMVMDKKKHPNEAGWGYALFDAGGHTFPDKPEAQIGACHACHEIAKDRGYVFSQLMKRDQPKTINSGARDIQLSTTVAFSISRAENLPPFARQALAQQTGDVYLVQGEMQSKFFQGTFNEIRPSLIKQSLATNRPAGLMSKDGRRFTFVWPAEQTCQTHGVTGRTMKVIYTVLPAAGQEARVPQQLDFCAVQ